MYCHKPREKRVVAMETSRYKPQGRLITLEANQSRAKPPYACFFCTTKPQMSVNMLPGSFLVTEVDSLEEVPITMVTKQHTFLKMYMSQHSETL